MARSHTTLIPSRCGAWLFFVLAGILATWPVGPGRAADEPATTTRQEALERFVKLSPQERLARVEKALGGKALIPVTRDDIDITLVERGVIDAAEISDIICRVKASAGGQAATTLKWLIDDGSLVKKGQRLLELDDSAWRDRLRVQQRILDRATAERVPAAEAVKIARKQGELDVRGAELHLKRARLELKKYTGIDADEKEILELQVAQGALAVDTVKLRSKSAVVAAEAALKVKEAVAEQESDALKLLEAQGNAYILTAPRDGLAVYYVPEATRAGGAENRLVAVGEPVVEGQKLLRVCGLERFRITTRIHEAVISRVRTGQKATVRVDAFPGRVLRGQVKEVATVASQRDWLTADVKVYPVQVGLDDHLAGLKPGMSGEVRIEGGRMAKVLRVPVEAVVRVGKDLVCFVKVGKEIQVRKVTPGARNERFVEIKDGLKEEEEVLAAPAAAVKVSTGSAAPRVAPIVVRSVQLPADPAPGRSRSLAYGLTYEDLEKLRVLPGVSEAVPVRHFPVEIRRLERQQAGQVIATVPSYLDLTGVRLAAGRFLEDADAELHQTVAVVGSEVVESLFPDGDALGGSIRVSGQVFRVVGILREQNQPVAGLPTDQVNRGVYIPLQVCRARFGETIFLRRPGRFTREVVALTAILLAVRSPEQTVSVGKAARAILEKAHRQKDWEIEPTAPEAKAK